MWLILFVIAVVLYYIDYCIHNSQDGKLIDNIPGPKPLPVIGNILDFLHGPVAVFYKTRAYANKYSALYKIWAGTFRVVNIYNPDDVEIILSSPKHIAKSGLYDFLHPWLKQGLLTSTGEKWQKRRKILTPAFHFNILKQFCRTFDEQSCQLVQRLISETEKKETDVIPFVTQFALHSICETAMGSRLSADDESVSAYKKAVYSMGEFVLYRLVRIWLQSDFIFSLTSVAKKQKNIIPVLHDFSRNVIEERRKSRIAESAEFAVTENLLLDEDVSGKRRMAMLDLLLQAESEGKIDDEGIREEVDTFMFEGHDTTAMAISFCLMLMANNMDAQDKVVAEMDEIFGDSTGPVSIDDLNKMKYLERCIKEALRLYPSVPFIARHITENVQLKEYAVPADTVFHIHIFDMHRCASIYPAPDVFDPDRFTAENCSKRHPFAYVPFSAGPRNCIGQKFALLEEKSIVSSILRKFVLEPITTPDDIVFSSDLVLRSKNPIKVKFRLRKNKE